MSKEDSQQNLNNAAQDSSVLRTESPHSAQESSELLKRARVVLEMLKRGPKSKAVCWCTGGYYKPPKHSSACKAASSLFAALSTANEPERETETQTQG